VLAKDGAYLATAAVLTAPLGLAQGLGPGMTLSLMALALGRWPSLKERAPQKAFRFSKGNARFGVGQVLVGGLMGSGCARIGGWFLLAAALLWIGSVWLGGQWLDEMQPQG
jgi:hypothetical protein